MKSKRASQILAITVVLLLSTAGTVAGGGWSLSGSVVDSDGDPVFGATVAVRTPSTIIAGTVTDTAGNFRLAIPDDIDAGARLSITSVGYTALLVPLSEKRAALQSFVLHSFEIEMPGIRVVTSSGDPGKGATLNNEEIRKITSRSVLAGDPLSVLRRPRIARQGSSLSSKIRVNGSNPTIRLNGQPIGSDLNHYGMFSVIPGDVIDRIKYFPNGTPARYREPSVFDLRTPNQFTSHRRGSFNLSLIEATGVYSQGNERYYVLGSLRKSVLDKLVNQFEIESDRRTLPPTNFQDIVASIGVKLSPQFRLYIDQYSTGDWLTYSFSSTAGNPNGISTSQHSTDWFTSGRLRGIFEKLLVDLAVTYRSTNEQYLARPTASSGADNFHLDLTSRQKSGAARVDATWFSGQTEVQFGGEVSYAGRNDVEMDQHNWNFLPYDAASDNPFVYQRELNDQYQRYSGRRKQLNSSAYTSMVYSVRRLKLDLGLRYDRFGSLSQTGRLNSRVGLTLRSADENSRSNLSIYYGTFAESPAQRIVEPYQVLIHAEASTLTPVDTRLLSLQYSRGPWRLGMFTKQIDNLPVVSPDFEKLLDNGIPAGRFIRMESSGKNRFVGSDISLDLKGLFASRLDVYVFYSYTHAIEQSYGVTVPYRLNAPHRAFVEAIYKLSRVVTLGGAFSARSGYPYTPTSNRSVIGKTERYTGSYYSNALAAENSSRFPSNIGLNLHLGFDLGATELYVNVANVTNRANPIVNASDGFIYDSGILPAVGVRYSF